MEVEERRKYNQKKNKQTGKKKHTLHLCHQRTSINNNPGILYSSTALHLINHNRIIFNLYFIHIFDCINFSFLDNSTNEEEKEKRKTNPKKKQQRKEINYTVQYFLDISLQLDVKYSDLFSNILQCSSI